MHLGGQNLVVLECSHVFVCLYMQQQGDRGDARIIAVISSSSRWGSNSSGSYNRRGSSTVATAPTADLTHSLTHTHTHTQRERETHTHTHNTHTVMGSFLNQHQVGKLDEGCECISHTHSVCVCVSISLCMCVCV